MKDCLIVSNLDISEEVLLWTNPNPSSSLSAGLLNVDISNYDYARIVHHRANSTAEDGETIFDISKLPTEPDSKSGYAIGSKLGASRKVYKADGKIGFDSAYLSTSASNNYLVPTEIYGIKGKRIPIKFPTDEELLWTNPNPTSNFSATTFTFNADEFNYLRIVVKIKTTIDTNPVSYIFSVDDISKYAEVKNNPISIGRRADSANYGRTIYKVGNSICIYGCYTGNTLDNAQAIPLRIYGIGRKQ